MPWNNQGGEGGGGGPWGQGGGKGGSPWGQGGGQPPQDVDALMRQFADAWRRMMPSGGGGGRSLLLLLIVFGIVWGITGFYRVNPQQQGVVLRFGEWVRTSPPGLHYHLPYPIEAQLIATQQAHNMAPALPSLGERDRSAS